MIKKNGYTLRLARKKDVDAYYERNYKKVDEEVARLSGNRYIVEEKIVKAQFLMNLNDPSRCDFLIVNPKGEIIGETIISDIDEETNSGVFHITIFHKEDCGKGIGTWAMQETLTYAFKELNLTYIKLEVYSFNERAMHIYEKLGFKEEITFKSAVDDGDKKADIILMSLLKDEYIVK